MQCNFLTSAQNGYFHFSFFLFGFIFFLNCLISSKNKRMNSKEIIFINLLFRFQLEMNENEYNCGVCDFSAYMFSFAPLKICGIS